MYIKHDYHYINANENLLIEKGYGRFQYILFILIGIIQKNRRKRIDRLQNL